MGLLPFDVEIQVDQKTADRVTVRCTTLLREIVGKRRVFEGLWDGREVIVKVFTSRLRGWYHVRREATGLENLRKRNISCPKLLFSGRDEKGLPILVTEKILYTQDLLAFFQQNREGAERNEVLSRWIRFVAQMHARGIMQKDLHAGNFLLTKDTLYALDPAQMRLYTGQLGIKMSFKQLAMLLYAIPYEDRLNLEPFLRRYCQSRNLTYGPKEIELFRSCVEKTREKTVRRRLKKTMRTSSRYIRLREGQYTGVYCRDWFEGEDAEAFFQDLNARMESGQILKRGNTCFVSRVRIGAREVVVKQYNYKGIVHSVRHTLKGSRARKCWLFGHRLVYVDIFTALPVAFIEKRKGPLIEQSYIINEYIDGFLLDRYLRSDHVVESEKENQIRKVKDLLDKLRLNRITHGDMKLTNILVHNGYPYLIDLDSIRYHFFHWTLDYYYHNMVHQYDWRISRELNGRDAASDTENASFP